MKNIVVLVSGGGTNLQALIDAQKRGEISNGKITCVISSNPNAYALTRAADNGIETEVIRRKDFDAVIGFDLFNKGLTVRVDTDDIAGGDWEARYVYALKNRLCCNEYRRTIKAFVETIKAAQKNDLIKHFHKVDADYLILDLGAGTHLTILDMFLLSPQGIVVTAPTVTATLNGYLFLKNVVFRMMYNTFKRGTKGYDYLEELKQDSASLQRLYIPKLVEQLEAVDPENTAAFKRRMAQFRPRLVLNMMDDPKDADRAQKIRRSCQQYLGLDLEHLGVMYRDSLQDKSLASRLPIVV